MYDDGKNVFMVMELMRGGELLDRILKHRSLSEREAALIMYSLASTFAFLHEEGVCLTFLLYLIVAICFLIGLFALDTSLR